MKRTAFIRLAQHARAIAPHAGAAPLLRLAATIVAVNCLVATPRAEAQTFADVSGPAMRDSVLATAFGVAWFDVDGDGDLDAVAATGDSSFTFRNDDGAWYRHVPVGLELVRDPYSSAWADYDNDGIGDVYHATGADDPNRLHRGEPGGSYLASGLGDAEFASFTTGVSWADIDVDGDLDLYAAVFAQGGTDRLLRNDGGGLFHDVAGPLNSNTEAGFGVAWSDFDADGDPDYVVTNPAATAGNQIYRNEGGGVFVGMGYGPYYVGVFGVSPTWADYDNDGDRDLYITRFTAPNELYRNDGAAGFVLVTAPGLADANDGTGVAWGDYDLDGWIDVYLANNNSENVLYRNQGDGTFLPHAMPGFELAEISAGLANADYDCDGDLDLFVTHTLADGSADHRVLRNDLVTTHSWIQIALQGTVSNRLGIGSKLRVVADGHVQVREVFTADGYLSQNAIPETFGLANAAVVDTLTVKWPAGNEQTFTNVPVNQKLLIIEVFAPAGPTDCAATDALCDRITVTWSDNATDEDGYWIYKDGFQHATLGPDATSFDDFAVAPGATHFYDVEAFNSAGASDACGDSGSVEEDVLAPTILTASDSACGAVDVSWGAVANADSFTLYRDGAPVVTLAAAVTSYRDSVAAGSYEYAVASIRGCRVSGTIADSAGVLPAAPAAPANFTASRALCDTVRLAWEASADADSYVVSSGGLTLARLGAATLIHDVVSVPGDTATYDIHAFNTCGTSPVVSDTGIVPPAAPASPASLTASDTSCTIVALRWTAAPRARNYHVYRNGAFVATVDSPTTGFDHPASSGGALYSVSASNDCGESAVTSDSGFVLPGTPTAPGALTASDDSCGAVHLAWTDRSTDETGFVVLRDGAPIDTTAPGVEAYVDSAAAAGAHAYAVAALGVCGESPTAEDPGGARGAPADAEPAAPEDGAIADVPVTLSWAGGDDAESWRVQVASDSDFQSIEIDSILTGNLTSLTLDSSFAGREYHWRVLASNACGETAFTAPRLIAVRSLRLAGDWNGDGFVDLLDLDYGVAVVLGEAETAPTAEDSAAGDLNADAALDVSDLVALIERIAPALTEGFASGRPFSPRPESPLRLVASAPPYTIEFAEDCARLTWAGPRTGAIVVDIPRDGGTNAAPGDAPAATLSTEDIEAGASLFWVDRKVRAIFCATAAPAVPGTLDDAALAHGAPTGEASGARFAKGAGTVDVIVGPALVVEDGVRVVYTEKVTVTLARPAPEPGTNTAPARTRLLASYPNPFNPSVTIPYELAAPASATLSVYDALGRRVATLIDGRTLPAGPGSVVWRGRDDAGRSVSSGAYFAVLRSGAMRDVRTMILLR